MKAMVYHGANDTSVLKKNPSADYRSDRCGGENRQNHDLRYRFGYLERQKNPKSPTVVFSVMKASVL